jgi:hypothetical protein
MLFKNGKEFSLTNEQISELEIAIGKRWPVTIRWVPEKVKKNPKNKIPDQPAATIIALTWPASIEEKNGTPTRTIVTYAENITTVSGFDGKTPRTDYIPNDIYFSGNRTFDKKDLELVWFLWYCYPAFRGGKNNSGKLVTDEIMFDLPQKLHEANVDFEEKLYEAKGLILGQGVTEDYLKTVAKAFFIPQVDTMNKTDVQNSLINFLNKGNSMKQKLETIESFMIIAGSKENVRVRSVVQAAIDSNLIEWDANKRCVYMVVEGKRYESPIAKVTANREWREFLYEIMIGTKEGQEQLAILEETLNANLKVKASKKPKE